MTLALARTGGCVTLYFYIIPTTECTGDKCPPGAQNRVSSVIMPHPVIENTDLTSPGECLATGEIIYLEGGMCPAFFVPVYAFPLFQANTSRVSSGPLPGCVSASLSFDMGSERKPNRLRCFIGKHLAQAGSSLYVLLNRAGEPRVW